MKKKLLQIAIIFTFLPTLLIACDNSKESDENYNLNGVWEINSMNNGSSLHIYPASKSIEVSGEVVTYDEKSYILIDDRLMRIYIKLYNSSNEILLQNVVGYDSTSDFIIYDITSDRVYMSSNSGFNYTRSGDSLRLENPSNSSIYFQMTKVSSSEIDGAININTRTKSLSQPSVKPTHIINNLIDTL